MAQTGSDTKLARYIASTRTHEHPFTIAAELDANSLPDRRFVTGEGYERLLGWFDYCGPAYGIVCAKCGKYLVLRANRISGKYSNRTKCDARCTSARGFNCECQCSGKHHGSDWSAS